MIIVMKLLLPVLSSNTTGEIFHVTLTVSSPLLQGFNVEGQLPRTTRSI